MAIRDRLASRTGRLRCGHTVDELWDKVAAGRAEQDPHVRSCPYCQSTVDGLTALREATAELVAEAPEAPSSLLRTVMRAVRTEARRGEMTELFGGPDTATVSLRAIAAMVRVVVDSFEGLTPHAITAHAGTEIDAVDVHIDAGLASGRPTEVERRLREQITEMLALGVSLRLGRLQVRVQAP